jgi:hypothetical protein
MSGIDLAGIRRRQERGAAYWEAMGLSWIRPSPAQDPRLAAYIGVIRDIPWLLEQLETVTAQRDEAWKIADTDEMGRIQEGWDAAKDEADRLRAQRDQLLALCDAVDSPEVEVARSVIYTDDIRAIYAEPTPEATP